MRVSTESRNSLTIIPECKEDTDYLLQLGLHPESAPLVRLACSSPHVFEVGGEDQWFLVEIRRGNIGFKNEPAVADTVINPF